MTAVMLHLPVTHLTMKWKISHKWGIKRFLPLDLLFLKLPFAVRPGLTDSRVANLIVLSNCTKMKVEMITVQGSSVKQWVQAQYTGLVSWVIQLLILESWWMENRKKCCQINMISWITQETNPVYWAYTHCLTLEPWTVIFINLASIWKIDYAENLNFLFNQFILR